MLKAKYDYKGTTEIIKKLADKNGEISKKDLSKALLGEETPKNNAIFVTALNNLKRRHLDSLGIQVNGVKDKDKKTVNVYSVSYSKELPVKVETSSLMTALQKDNQKLFLEKEQLIDEVVALREEVRKMKEKEVEYKNLITSFYSLTMVA